MSIWLGLKFYVQHFKNTIFKNILAFSNWEIWCKSDTCYFLLFLYELLFLSGNILEFFS